ncbi:hypothetical protein AB7M43_003700 [Bradyrhizobium elkanii]
MTQRGQFRMAFDNGEGRQASCHTPAIRRPYKTRVRMPSKLNPHIAPIGGGSLRSRS